MSCQECIHGSVCAARPYGSDGCVIYKDKSRYVELPCKVGDTVYVIEPLWYGIWSDDEHKCRKCEHFYEGGMGDPSDCSLGNNCCYHIVETKADLRHIADWITPSMFMGEIAWGKTVFLTREEAEKALKGKA